MPFRPILAVCVLAASVAGFAPAPAGLQPRPTVDPTGQYDMTLTDDAQPVPTTMSVQGSPGEYTGRIKAAIRPEVAISTLTASGNLVTVTADVPQGVLLLRFRMNGDSLRGDWSLKGDGGRLVGLHRAASGK